jgi:two-component system, NtrC family, sensor kinase
MATLALAVAAVFALALAAREVVHLRRQAALRARIDELRMHAREAEQVANVGQLVSGLAQDLKGPLQGVIGVTELMLATPADAANADALNEIREHAARAAGIVRNLLAFTESVKPTPRWQDLNEVVDRAVSSCRAEMDAAGVRVVVERRDRLPLVYVDGRQLEKVVSTLLSRPGLAASDKADVAAVTLATTRRDGRDDRVVIDVDGRGAGDATDDAAWSADLAACRQIMETHGGSLDVLHSAAGACRFHLELPLMATVPTGSESAWTRSSTSST